MMINKIINWCRDFRKYSFSYLPSFHNSSSRETYRINFLCWL